MNGFVMSYVPCGEWGWFDTPSFGRILAACMREQDHCGLHECEVGSAYLGKP